ncbi:MAG: DNA-3-methyladenine glycosylase 2 family protein [Spirochaetaceae bacterium]|jgi:DNA-3-methyladenine glycosylase II|nr:DNA-3-methyladenine glycosylase 2 family protein [Spirochaetaceae bacterium]
MFKNRKKISFGVCIILSKERILYFKYGDKETAYLKSKDSILGKAIDSIGHIKRPVDRDLFSAVIHHIVGQQISSAAQKTIWKRINDKIGKITVDSINGLGIDEIQKFGTTFRKAEYIKSFAGKVKAGEFILDDIPGKSDGEIVKQLSNLKGIGIWTAEMILIFCLQRPDILSYNDLAIHRGLRILYHHRKIDRKLFEKYRRRFSPYCSVASLYLWAAAGGVVKDMKDYPASTTGTRQGSVK